MEDSISESEADSLFTLSRTGSGAIEQPDTYDNFLQFVRLMAAVEYPPGAPVLAWRRSPESEPEFSVLKDRFTLGKRTDCDLSLPDVPFVSRLHFVIERTPAGYLLTDHSQNGTFLNSGTCRLPRGEPYLLKDGDLLWVEGVVIAFKAASD